MQNICSEYFENSPMGYGFGKILRNEKKEISDFEILYLNRKMRELITVNNLDDSIKRVSRLLNTVDPSLFLWISEHIKIAVDEKISESEIFSPVFSGWFKCKFESYSNDHIGAWFYDISSEKTVIDVSQKIIKSKVMTLEELAEKARTVAEAKYCLLNLFSEDASFFTTVSVAGNKQDLPIIKQILGFDPEKKTWPTEKIFTTEFKNTDIFHLKTFDSFMGLKIPEERLRSFKELLNIGRISICKIESDDKLLGILTLIFEKGRVLQNEYNLINFAQLIGLYLIRKNLEEEKRKIEESAMKNREKLKKEKERLENVINGINAGTWEWEIPTGKTNFNEKWASMLGYVLKELEPTSYSTWDALVFEEDRPKAEKALQDHLDGKTEFYDTEFRMIHKDGSLIWVQDQGKVEKWSEEGKPLLMYGTHQDITLRKMNELALKNAKKEKEVFFASISHDLKNPMNSIIGFARLLKELNVDSEEIDYIDSILESSSKMMQLISNILDFSKAEAGKINITLQRVLIRELISKEQRNLLQRIKNKNIQFECVIDRNIPEYIITDPLRLSQVITNLLDNAVKFTEDGVITLRLESVSNTAGKTEIKFSVKDTGIGMTNDEQLKIFNSFSQANAGIEGKYGGSGLGLFITKIILELMGSTLCISSKKDMGSEFYFTLPYSEK